MAQFTIKLFATMKDKAGRPAITVDVAAPLTVAELLADIGKNYPALRPALGTVLVAVNRAFAFGETIISEGDEIALFPPVSGGTFPHPTYFAITEEELDLNAIHARLRQPDVGAIVSFTGSVRGATSREGLPTQTSYLEYEAYTDMATLKMAQIAHEIWEQWPLVKGIAIVQRIGKLDVGETTTFVACASGHRDQGVFDAARYGIDRLKEIVPVWKKEVGQDQSVWVEGSYQPTAEDNL
ncbi:MAG: molybdenum cofactor biosynthesis protein MoaE [Anaerolineales bacterium]|nr:molybdenum cofactor biosynthesis protein MoaE [Anaerolineales bacterium]